MQLGKIQLEDLKFTNHLEDDRTNTYLTLSDYDWMNYNLATRFTTDLYGRLQVEFKFFGATTSTMEVARINNDNTSEIFEYEYPTEIFEKYIKQFMEHHIKSWSDEFAFNGEDDVLTFYNEVIEVGILQ